MTVTLANPRDAADEINQANGKENHLNDDEGSLLDTLILELSRSIPYICLVIMKPMRRAAGKEKVLMALEYLNLSILNRV